jgi:hypothetical protein
VEAYAHKNAMYQTPWELVGDVAVGKMVKGIFKSIPRGTITAGPDAFGQWLGPQFERMATATAGEVFVTTPGQMLGEAFIAERAGVRAPTTFGEKVAQTGDAMSIALGSVTFTGGASMATAGATKAGKGDFAETSKPVNPYRNETGELRLPEFEAFKFEEHHRKDWEQMR